MSLQETPSPQPGALLLGFGPRGIEVGAPCLGGVSDLGPDGLDCRSESCHSDIQESLVCPACVAGALGTITGQAGRKLPMVRVLLLQLSGGVGCRGLGWGVGSGGDQH